MATLTEIQMSMGCPICGGSADYPDRPVCPCGAITISIGTSDPPKPDLKLVK